MIDNIIYENINGTTLAFIPKKHFVEKQAMICFKYGSMHNNIKIDGENINLPAGIAHFLEHKMFEKKDYNVFDRFNKLGANVNAYTNFLSTTYYFNCVDNFYENFNELLNLVSKPHFTDENVEKEKPIIEQEIKMYDDDPYWRVFFNLMKIMYDKNNTITNDIAGSVEDIKNINSDMIYKCYNSFYTKDNCIIICCGDLDDKIKIENSILKNLNINEKKTGVIQKYEQKYKNMSNYVEKKMGINQKIFNIGFKNFQKNGTIFDKIVANKLFLDIIFGKSSLFYEKLYSRGIIDDTFGFDFNNFDENASYIFSGISKDPKEIVKYINEEINKVKNNGIFNEDFNRIKNKHIGNFVRRFNIIDNIVSMEADYFSNGFNIKSYYKSLESVTLENIQQSLEYFEKDAYLSVIN
ncbi:EF-P 5-aminopentanol modification-associated protein YfmH [[Clostridium] colinum]|uniref:EF-P 5-aminopentanol modification-associated protein YfmH n=1 Tax=[Clostridium] colinum TaxID=36835 RepID=UPI0020249571|nr:pitrilysin family protein [[Clostridium] colinum]